MTRRSGGPVGGRTALQRQREQVLMRAALGLVLVVGFEALLYLAAVTLFTHLDTPGCAGSDTFCSLDGRPGLTGGAVVVLAGNLVAVVVLLLALIVRRSRARRH